MPERGARLLPLPGGRAVRAPAAGPATEPDPVDPARLSRLEALRAVRATPRGLTESEAEARIAECGENIVLPLPEPGPLRRLRTAFGDPFTALLAGLTVICALSGSWGSAAIVAILVLGAGLLRLRGERRSAAALRALRALAPSTATVLRRAGQSDLPIAREVPAEQLVPGDVVRLAGGDAVPADLRLLRAEGLTVDQSALTGESTPVSRAALDLPPTAPPGGPFDEPQLCFAGSTVITGGATAVVLATGAATRFGAAHAPGPLSAVVPGPGGRSVVERGVRRAVLTLIVFMLAVVPLTIGTDALLHGWSSALLPFAVAAAVGLTPELLPLVVSTVLASGGHRLAKAGMPVRALPAVSELGALDLLCLDKTGTLTTGELVVAGALDPFGRPDQEPLRWAGLVGEAGLLDDDPGLLDPLDEALLTAADAAGLLTDPLPTVVEVIPFDPVRRRSGAVLRGPGSGRVLVVKGAPEAVLERCDTLAGGAALDRAARAALARLVEERAGQGLRLIAVARAEREPRLGPHRAQDEEGLTLLGFVELLDEPEDSAEAALAVLRRSGIALTVLTGDHPRTALRLAQRLGLTPGRVLLGAELAALDPGSIAAAGAAGAVFARCTPEQKAQVVRALRAAGQCVGFLGDGVNDVPALRAADVGIATAGAVGAAREWADLLLGERDLTRLGRAVAVGREATARVGAYLRIALSCNLGNVLSMLAGGVLLPFLPMQPAQVLLQNLCFDAAQLSFAVSGRSAGLGGRPARLRWGALAGFAVGFGLLNSFSDIAMFEAMRQVTHGFTAPNSAAMFHTAWFTENLVTQAMALPVLYRLSRPRLRPPRPVWWAAGLLALVGLLLPPSALGERLGFEELPPAAYGSLALVVAGYAALLGVGRWLWWRFSERAERRAAPAAVPARA
ncbi:Mg2+-importing ATPase [Kitasatospora sp. GAS204A]|uniref:HAD-IC family P-type ATPase n=1 Tax=unclassified Kitasatospora TaxID=2633591 RepID=UPI002472EE77|nr:HAD-IC family P-type ATPase [Kitasatospora sp. GAS204B]MDH6118647.1 Mg2+-importing ATPase [Kitasatospora sp. GAS204B]